MSGERFELAPMSRGIRVLTVGLFLIPSGFLLGGLLSPEAWVLLPVGLFVAAIYASVWFFWRPRAFVVAPECLEIDFPMRSLRIPAHDIESVESIAPGALRERIGFAVRVGAGGLWGGFGWLWTRRRGTVEFYVSHTGDGVWIERRTGQPLLITPAQPERFVEALASRLA